MFNLFGNYHFMDLDKVLKDLDKRFKETEIEKSPAYENITLKYTLPENEINKLIDERLKTFKPEVRILQEAINKAVKKYFDELVFTDEKTGKKCDTYDIIRKFAMDTIGVTENGQLSPEFVKIVRDEVASLVVDKFCKDEEARPIEELEEDNTYEDDEEFEEYSEFPEEPDNRVSIDDVNKLLRMAKLTLYTDENGELRIAKIDRGSNLK